MKDYQFKKILAISGSGQQNLVVPADPVLKAEPPRVTVQQSGNRADMVNTKKPRHLEEEHE